MMFKLPLPRLLPISSLSRGVVGLGFAALLAACGGGGGGSGGEQIVQAAVMEGDELVAQALAEPATSAASAHFARLNEVRAQMRLPKLRWHGALANAAQSHAEYLALNQTSGHEQQPGAAGFTGESIADRTRAAGYRSALVQEVKAGGSSSTADEGRERMDALLLAPLHRLQLLAPEFDEAGVGVTADGGPLVTDLGSSGARARTNERRWMYPFNGQTNVPAIFMPGTEVGLPLDMPQTTGTPLTLSGFLFSLVSYTNATLHEEHSGREIALATQAVPGVFYGALVFFPAEELKPDTHYVWKITATVDRIKSATVSKFVTAPIKG